METLTVYRNGPLAVGDHSAAIKRRWASFDAFAPANCASRLDSLFAAPDIRGVLRWVKSKHMYENCFGSDGRDLSTNEITVINPDALFAHRISDYDTAMRCYGNRITVSQIEAWINTGVEPFVDWGEAVSLMEAYWVNAIRLSDWDKTSVVKNLDSSEWEVLVPPENIVSAKKLSDRRLLDACSTEDSRHALSSLIREVRLQQLGDVTVSGNALVIRKHGSVFASECSSMNISGETSLIG